MQYKDLTEEQKRRRNKSNSASIQRYDAAHYRKVTVRVPKGEDVPAGMYEMIEAAAAAAGQSVNAWILDAIRDKL